MVKNSLGILKGYILSHRVSFIGFVLFLVGQYTMYFLYNICIEPLLYSCYISFLITIPFFLFDIKKYANLHKQLNQLQQNWDGEIIMLDNVDDVIWKDYQTLISKVNNYNKKIKERYRMIELERIDYYTFWTHQIKTPIYSMDIMLQTGEIDSSELKQRLFQINQYVDMALKYLHLENQFSDFSFRNCDLFEMVQNTVRKFSGTFISKNIKINIENINITVLTDEKWTTFVLEQILSNSLKYSNSGMISIYSGKENTLIIEDEGIGISQQDLPKVFDKGFTGINGRITQRSSGIGLYLCKKVMDQLGHKIVVCSEAGVGTKVQLNF